jgi:hypothetical protein
MVCSTKITKGCLWWRPALARLADFNPNHDEKGLFSSGPLGGSEAAAFNASFAQLAARYPDQLAARLSKIANVASQGGGEGEGEDEDEDAPEHEQAAKEAIEHWRQLGQGIAAIGDMWGWRTGTSKAGDTWRTKSSLAKAVQSGAYHATGVAIKAAADVTAEHVTEALSALAGSLVGGAVGGGLVGGPVGALAGYAVDKLAEHFGLTPAVAQHMLVVGGRAMSEHIIRKCCRSWPSSRTCWRTCAVRLRPRAWLSSIARTATATRPPARISTVCWRW